MNSENKDSTRKYLEENKYIFSLKRNTVLLHGEKKRKLDCMSIPVIFYRKVHSLLSLIKNYTKIYIKYKREISNLSNIKKEIKNNAIVIGNGPSQGYLTAELLHKFQLNGNCIYAVSFWNKNKAFDGLIPNYLVISDPSTLADPNKVELHQDRLLENINLIQYLIDNKNIKIICPFEKCSYIEKLFGSGRVYGFCDLEIRWISSNIDPRLPRGYLSMTLLKALSFANFIGHKKIFIIGMDNTYPRNLYCDNNNHVINHEVHAGQDDYINDFTPLTPSISIALQDYLYIFADTDRCFSKLPVVNLDPYSLTDAFPKISCISMIDSVLTST